MNFHQEWLIDFQRCWDSGVDDSISTNPTQQYHIQQIKHNMKNKGEKS